MESRFGVKEVGKGADTACSGAGARIGASHYTPIEDPQYSCPCPVDQIPETLPRTKGQAAARLLGLMFLVVGRWPPPEMACAH